MSKDSRDRSAKTNVGSLVVVEKEELKGQEGKVVDEVKSPSRVGISGDDDTTSFRDSELAIGTGSGSAHSGSPRSEKSTEIVNASPLSESTLTPTRRSRRLAARSAAARVIVSSNTHSPKKRVLRMPRSFETVETGKSTRKSPLTPEALSGKKIPESGFDTGRRRKRGDMDKTNVDAAVRRVEDARGGDEKAPERRVEEEKTAKVPDKRRGKGDDKQKQETEEMEEGNDERVEDDIGAPERLVEEEKTGKDPDKRPEKGDDKQKQKPEEMEEGNDVEEDMGAPERLVEEEKAGKDLLGTQEINGEEKDSVGVEEETGAEEVGEHEDTTDGGETELEEEKEEEEREDATEVEEEGRRTAEGGLGTEERKGLQEMKRKVKEDVLSGDNDLGEGDDDTAQERAMEKESHKKEKEQKGEEEEEERTVEGRKGTEERKELQKTDREMQEVVLSGDDDLGEGKDDSAQEKATKKRKNREEEQEEGEEKDEDENEDTEEEEDGDENEDTEEEEDEDEDEVDIDAMIKLASSAAKGHTSAPRGDPSGAGVAGGKRLAVAAVVDGKTRPRKSGRGGAITALDSGLSSPKGLLHAGSKKKKESLPTFVSPRAVDGKVTKLYAGSALYSCRDRAMSLKKTTIPKDETAGKGWFHMEQAEMTPELKRDLQVVRMRNYLDPKRFYKSSDKVSKFVQVGTVKEGPGEFFSSRMTNKERKKTLVDELLVADENFRTYAKNKYNSIQEKKQAGGKAHYKNLSRKRARGPKWKP